MNRSLLNTSHHFLNSALHDIIFRNTRTNYFCFLCFTGLLFSFEDIGNPPVRVITQRVLHKKDLHLSNSWNTYQVHAWMCWKINIKFLFKMEFPKMDPSLLGLFAWFRCRHQNISVAITQTQSNRKLKKFHSRQNCPRSTLTHRLERTIIHHSLFQLVMKSLCSNLDVCLNCHASAYFQSQYYLRVSSVKAFRDAF